MDIKQESRPAAIGLTAGIAVMQGDKRASAIRPGDGARDR